jgi:hypothetical protein
MINNELTEILQQLSIWIMTLVPPDHIGNMYFVSEGTANSGGGCVFYLTKDGVIVHAIPSLWYDSTFALFQNLGILGEETGEEFGRVILTIDKGEFNLAVTYPDQMLSIDEPFADTRARFTKEFFGVDTYTWVDPEGEADLAMNVEIDGNIDFEDMQPRKPH